MVARDMTASTNAPCWYGISDYSVVRAIYIYTRVGWKVHRLTKILSWNVIKCLFFNIVPFVVHRLLPSVWQWLDPISKKKLSTADMTLDYELFRPPSYIYIYIHTQKIEMQLWICISIKSGLNNVADIQKMINYKINVRRFQNKGCINSTQN